MRTREPRGPTQAPTGRRPARGTRLRSSSGSPARGRRRGSRRARRRSRAPRARRAS
jgi:hypothetical protein